MPSHYLTAAEILLGRTERALTARQLVDEALKDRLLDDELAGKTPWQTMQARLSEEIRRNGDRSRFVRVRPGQYQLRGRAGPVYDAPPFKPPKPKERVLVIPHEHFYNVVDFQGIKDKGWFNLKKQLLNRSVCKYMDRYEAEQDDSHKQVLTYVMVTRENQVLAYTRGRYNRVEEYLRGSRCIGFGGHVNERDLSLLNRDGDLGVVDCAARELTEELNFPARERFRILSSSQPKVIGILNDDSSAVGRRHMAFVLNYEVEASREWTTPRRGERSITRLRWLAPGSRDCRLDQFEYWSQLCLRSFYKRYVSESPSFFIRRRSVFMQDHVLCVVGAIGSGKTQTTAVLVSDFGYHEINSGRVLAQLLGMPPVPTTERAVFQTAALQFILQADGPQRLGAALARFANGQLGGRALVDGVRHRATLAALRRALAPRPLAVVFVHTPADVAFKFYTGRARTDVPFRDFFLARENPVEAETSDLISEADAILYNWSGKENHTVVVRAMMGEVGVRTR